MKEVRKHTLRELRHLDQRSQYMLLSQLLPKAPLRLFATLIVISISSDTRDRFWGETHCLAPNSRTLDQGEMSRSPREILLCTWCMVHLRLQESSILLVSELHRRERRDHVFDSGPKVGLCRVWNSMLQHKVEQWGAVDISKDGNWSEGEKERGTWAFVALHPNALRIVG